MILDKVLADIDLHGFSRPVIWQTLKNQGKVAFDLIYFLLTAGLMNVFLVMTRELKHWDPDTVEGRARYLKLFELLPGNVPDDLAQNYIDFAFKGPKGVKRVMDKLIEHQSSGSRDFLRKLTS